MVPLADDVFFALEKVNLCASLVPSCSKVPSFFLEEMTFGLKWIEQWHLDHVIDSHVLGS